MVESCVKSPCIMVCRLDDNKICVGCFRTEQEIEQWTALSDQRKNDVLKKSYSRYNKMRKAGLTE